MGTVSRWLAFLAIFLCIYGSLHLYMLVKVRRALQLEGVGYYLLIAVLAYLMFCPLQAHLYQTQGHPLACLVTTWIGFLWMGYIFIFVCLAAPIDTYHLIMSGLMHLFEVDWTDYVLLRRQTLTLVSVVAACLMVYGAVEAYRVPVERIVLHSAKIPEGLKRVRIAQISDMHLGPMFYPGRLTPIVAAIEKVQPDILVCTGDLIDGPLSNEGEIAQVLRALPAHMGKFAVTGNHEYYLGIAHALAFLQSAGFQTLRNTTIVVKDILAIAGVDDPAGATAEQAIEPELLAQVPVDKFSILLKHRPVIHTSSQGQFDLQLSGHTHKGQIFPFSLIIHLFYPNNCGLRKIGPENWLYTSRGTGTWGPPIRVLARPEITVIDLLPN